MSNCSPLVSIGMPVQNCENTVHQSLRSVLEQTYSHWELMIVDDGSTDHTLDMIRRFNDSRIRVYADGNHRGLISRLNQLIEISQGKYFARMDGDDVAYPERLIRQVAYLEQHPSVDLVGTWVLVFDPAGNPLGKRSAPEVHSAICAKPYAGFPIAHPTYVGRLEWFRRYGYRHKAIRCEDQDLLLRSYRFSQFANVPEILLGYREGKIYLKKILRSRWFFARALTREFVRQRKLRWAARAALEQGLKAMIDCFAVGSGLNYRLLRHRAQPITEIERRKWEHVWKLVKEI
jgi:glycosyltransferase involved in cell wall biosynthesis